MALFVQTPEQLLKELNQLNDAVATLADIQFGVPEPTTPEEKAQFQNKDTKCVITGVGAKYHGSQTIYYNRLDLSTPFANQLMLLTFVQPASTLYAARDQLNEQLSTTFLEADIEDFVFQPDQTEGVLELVAKSGSIGWQGRVSIAYVLEAPAIIEIPDVNLDGVMTPNDSTLLEQAALRYAFWDFHLNRAFIDTVVVGDLPTEQATALIDIFKEIDQTPWVATGTSEYSLEGAKVLYNGPSADWAICRQYKNVLVIELSAKSTLLTGELYLHYNNPEA